MNHPHPAIVSASSCSRDAEQVASDIAKAFEGHELSQVLFFCSAEYDLPSLAKALRERFGDTDVAGCTTAGELTPDGYEQGSVSAVAFLASDFAVSATLIEDLEDFQLADAQTCVDGLIVQCRQRELTPIKGNTFVLTLLDGLSHAEERVLLTLSSALGSIPHFGGSAGDDIHLSNTHVFFNGRFYDKAAVVLMFNTPHPFEVFSTHHMRGSDTKLVVTEADHDSRVVYELNAEPAALEYARTIGVKVEDLNHRIFALNPIAVRYGDEYYVRSIQKVNDDLSLSFYCAVETGIVLTVMQPDQILKDLEHQVDSLQSQVGESSTILACDCFLRRLEVQALDNVADATKLLTTHHIVGFNSYGEHIAGMHVNQTFTGVAIGQKTDDR